MLISPTCTNSIPAFPPAWSCRALLPTISKRSELRKVMKWKEMLVLKARILDAPVVHAKGSVQPRFARSRPGDVPSDVPPKSFDKRDV